MRNFHWSAALDVDNEVLNGEHQSLLREMGELENLNRRLVPKQELLDRLSSFIGQAQGHFDDEELYLQQIGYPGLESHVKLHKQLIASMNRYGTEFSRSTDGSLPSAVFDFFQMWMTTHIMLADRKYAEYAKKRGQAAQTSSPRHGTFGPASDAA